MNFQFQLPSNVTGAKIIVHDKNQGYNHTENMFKTLFWWVPFISVQLYIGSTGRLFGSGHEYIKLEEISSYRVFYEISMTQERALSQPDRECHEPEYGQSNLALCIEGTLGKMSNCSLGMMARLEDNRTLCDRRSEEFQALKQSESSFNVQGNQSGLQLHFVENESWERSNDQFSTQIWYVELLTE